MKLLAGLSYSQAREVLRCSFSEMDKLIEDERLHFYSTAFYEIVSSDEVRSLAAGLIEERIAEATAKDRLYSRRRARKNNEPC